MKEFGSKNTPLSVIGMFFNYAGNHMLREIQEIQRIKMNIKDNITP
jgi:hypothetical protein